MDKHIAVLEELAEDLREWGDGAALRGFADRLTAAIALMRWQSEPVAWQRRFRRHGKDEWTPWRDCSEEDFQFYREHKTNAMGEAETRILVVAPPKDTADEQ